MQKKDTQMFNLIDFYCAIGIVSLTLNHLVQ